MTDRSPRNNHNPRFSNCNRNDNNNGDGSPPPPPPLGLSLNHADLMAIAAIVATRLQGLANFSNVNQPSPLPPHNEIRDHQPRQQLDQSLGHNSKSIFQAVLLD